MFEILAAHSLLKKKEQFAPYYPQAPEDVEVYDTVTVMIYLLSLLVSVYAALLSWRCHKRVFETALAFIFPGLYLLVFIFTGGKCL